MLEIWKSLIEQIVSWPIVVLVLCLIFYKPLRALIDRISSIKGPGFDFSAPPASAQIAEKTIEPPESLKGEIVPAPSSTTATAPAAVTRDELVAKKEAIKNFGKGIPIVDVDVDKIVKQLAALDMPLDSEDTVRILVRHLAATQLMLRCERTHRPIFGSQIAALHLMNQQGPQPESAIKPIFEAARSKEPQFYGLYSFENWIGFLIGESAVRCDSGLYGITVYGRSYLEYIGVYAPYPKPH
jgi:hypothetical protein